MIMINAGINGWISEEKISFADALTEAQRKGYAETNPILDTGGFDAKYKLQIEILC